jgi:hypothetical protein
LGSGALTLEDSITSFVGEVQRAIRRAGGNPNRDPGTGKGGGRFNARGRGAATALSLKDRSAWSQDGSADAERYCPLLGQIISQSMASS